MEIGINLENYESPMEYMENLVCEYGKDREVGYLKINPERIPIIVSEAKAIEDCKAKFTRTVAFDIKKGRYSLVVDDRGVSLEKGDLLVPGNAYIIRKQRNNYSAMTLTEIEELLKYLPKLVTERGFLFKYDADRRCWG